MSTEAEAIKKPLFDMYSIEICPADGHIYVDHAQGALSPFLSSSRREGRQK